MMSYAWPPDVEGRAIRMHSLTDDISYTAARVIFYSNKHLCDMTYSRQLQKASSTPGYTLLRKIYIVYGNPFDCSTSSLSPSFSAPKHSRILHSS